MKVHYSARSPQPLTGLKVLVDGRPVSAEGCRKSGQGERGTLRPDSTRDCEVSVIAENRHAASEPATVRLRWKGAAAAKEEFQIKPKLYVLAVGVSQYQDAELRLDLAAKDALDFGSVWNEQKGRLYSGVEVRFLTDAQATKGNILDGLEWLQRQVTQKDVAVLFFAGHGINDPNGMFYFLPVDADPERLKRTGISQSDITSTVATIAGKVLVFMDACHSGNLMGKVKRRGVVVTSAVVNELASAENGAVVFSSATGRQYSQENPEWGNGAFTKGLVEGLTGKADYKGTGRITMNMLDLYVSERVKELTQGQQTPSTVKPPNVPDFPLSSFLQSHGEYKRRRSIPYPDEPFSSSLFLASLISWRNILMTGLISGGCHAVFLGSSGRGERKMPYFTGLSGLLKDSQGSSEALASGRAHLPLDPKVAHRDILWRRNEEYPRPCGTPAWV